MNETKYEQFLRRIDSLREQGLHPSATARCLGISPITLQKYMELSGQPPLPSYADKVAELAEKVKAQILLKGGSPQLVLKELGYEDFAQRAPAIVTRFKKQGWDWRYHQYSNLTIGNYTATTVVEGHYELPSNHRRINVTCLKCGHKHPIALSQFSNGKGVSCAYCPDRVKKHRQYLLVETGEQKSLMALWRKHLQHILSYQVLRYTLLKDSFYKSPDGEFTVTLVQSDEDDIVKDNYTRGDRRNNWRTSIYMPKDELASVQEDVVTV